jgi:hypothetical protein
MGLGQSVMTAEDLAWQNYVGDVLQWDAKVAKEEFTENFDTIVCMMIEDFEKNNEQMRFEKWIREDDYNILSQEDKENYATTYGIEFAFKLTKNEVNFDNFPMKDKLIESVIDYQKKKARCYMSQ